MKKILIVPILFALSALSGTQERPSITVTELPPEAFQTGICKASDAGFVGVVEKNKTERTKLTSRELGDYINKRLKEGYSITLHPLVSGRIYAVATCHPSN